MSIIGIDPQANGWRDDGTEGGILRTESVSAGLVAVPFPTQGFVRTVAGSGIGAFQSNHPMNPDGSGNAFWMRVTGTGQGARCFVPFRGTTLGIRYLIPAATTVISVGVDGDQVPVDLNEPEMIAESTTFVGTVGSRVTHRNLDPDVPHMAELTMVYEGVNKDATIYGFLLDSAAGYSPAPHRLTAREFIAVGTTRASINIVSSAHVFGCIQSIMYHNTTGAPITITISDVNSNTLATYSVAANGTEIVDFGGCVAAARHWYHAASAVGVNATIMGGAL